MCTTIGIVKLGPAAVALGVIPLRCAACTNASNSSRRWASEGPSASDWVRRGRLGEPGFGGAWIAAGGRAPGGVRLGLRYGRERGQGDGDDRETPCGPRQRGSSAHARLLGCRGARPAANACGRAERVNGRELETSPDAARARFRRGRAGAADACRGTASLSIPATRRDLPGDCGLGEPARAI